MGFLGHIAWEAISRPKPDGGLGILPFEDQALALKMRQIVKLLTGDTKEWTIMVRRIMRNRLYVGIHKKERRHWSPADAVLLCPDLLISGSPILKGMIARWNKSSEHLHFQFGPGSLPSKLSAQQLLFERNSQTTEQWRIDLRRFMANQGIKSIADLVSPD